MSAATSAEDAFAAEMAAARGTFLEEAVELLADLEARLLELDRAVTAGVTADAGSTETVGALFRAVHTLKGSAGLFGFSHLVRFAHTLETVLDRVRDGSLAPSAALVGALLPCGDHLATLIGDLASGSDGELPGRADVAAALLAGLEPFLSDEPAAGGAGDAAPAPASGLEAGVGAAEGELLHLSLRFGPDALADGMDPLSFVAYLGGLGDVVALSVLDDLLPPLADADPHRCRLALEVSFRSRVPRADVEGVFDFVREDGDIRVLPVAGPVEPFELLVETYGELGPRVRALLEESGAWPALAPPAPAPAASPREAALKASGAPASGAPASGASASGASASGVPAPERRPGESSLRVDAARLDRLIDAVGELVIAGAGAGLKAALVGDEALTGALGEVMRLVEEVRDSALQLRMVPIGTTFGRFSRIVRDVGTALGKEVDLVVTGGETELDKGMVEQIADPLVHLVRNALDHGIESPSERLAAGKPARGTLRLDAVHDSAGIVIEVSDDGRGIDPQKVLARAVARGLVEPGAELGEKEILALLFTPGFSTAEQVSDLSGRGVGMDVVHRNVTDLRGTVEVTSTVGVGTTWRVRLPLTLAIIDGFGVGVGEATYVIPLDRVVECVALPEADRHRGRMSLRGDVLPLVRLRSLYDVAGVRPRRENVVVVEDAGVRVGLVVDALRGEFQTVIKPLGDLFANVQGIGGSTILGNGDVALIVDVGSLVGRALDGDRAQYRRGA
ncbi:MAG: chemotaxis protein CheA [Kineosporiaceae bacterium]